MRDPAPLTPQPAYLDHAAARRIVVGVLVTMLLAALDQVMVATALPTIAASLGDVDNMSWVVTANLLCGTAATPLYGKLSDIHGRRTMMLIAIGIYAAGSLACALAPTMPMLILGRALQGLGGGGLMPLVQTIIGDVASPRDRPRYQSYTSSTFIISMVGGPLMGGFVAEHLHWSWIFWVNLPLCALAFLFTHNVLRRLPRHDHPHELDVLGAVLMVGAAIALMLALSWGGRRYGWASPQILGLCAASAALWILFAWRVMTAAEPFIPLAVLRDGAVCVGTLVAFFAVGAMIALTIFLPLYAQLALGLSVSEFGRLDHRAARRRHAELDRRRPPARALRPLQTGAALRPRALDGGARPACARAGGIFARRSARLDRARGARIGTDIPVHGRGGAERGRAASARCRHRHDELLPRARLDLHRRRLRRHRARGRARDPRHVGRRGADGHGCRAVFPVGLRRQHPVRRRRVRLHSCTRGAPPAGGLAQLRLNRFRARS